MLNHTFIKKSHTIQIVPMNQKYSECYRMLRNIDSNRAFFFSDKIISDGEQKAWFENYLNDETQIMFAVLDHEGGFIGGCGLYYIDDNSKAEFGRIVIDEKMRGKGIGCEVVRLVLEVAKKINIKHVYSIVKSDNSASRKMFRRVGFVEENSYSKDDHVCFELDLNEYNGYAG